MKTAKIAQKMLDMYAHEQGDNGRQNENEKKSESEKRRQSESMFSKSRLNCI